MQCASTIADLSEQSQIRETASATPHDDVAIPVEEEEERGEELLPDYEGLFEMTPQQQGTPYS